MAGKPLADSRAVVLVLLPAVAWTVLLTNATFAAEGSGVRAARLVPSAADRAAAIDLSALRYHIFRAATEAGRKAPLNGPLEASARADFGTAPTAQGAQAVQAPRFFPADLSYFAGMVVKSAVFNNIYVDCPDESCWGDPEGFQTNLVNSGFIHIADQYVGSRANRRYSLGARFLASSADCTSATFCSASDVRAIVHAIASDSADGGGSGYTHIINVFLPQGIDTCTDVNNTVCYSPDIQATNVFCGYHMSNVFPDIGETLFTVEPYQNVPGCAVQPGSPNGQLTDSTASTLVHETFETITDPDQNSWIAQNSEDDIGMEIGDVCQPPSDASGFIAAPVFPIGNKLYQVQLMYSNRFHDCTASASH